eukprot:TRINITY_DN8474_c0_g1_i1.p1 TRINITY_DN8474_c0_g1~~TRINITY_DN8474_c0_g1_i1.p1  ORF type:complete len:428 (+),score=127.55 TRINITY_DN8474_c0_g1_i1:59-1342(+)
MAPIGKAAVIAAAAVALYLLHRRRNSKRRGLPLPDAWATQRQLRIATVQGDVVVGETGLVFAEKRYFPFRLTKLITKDGNSVVVTPCVSARLLPLTITFSTAEAASSFYDNLREAVYGKATTIYMLVNPFAGTASGVQTYRKVIEPILAASPHRIQLHVTERQGHAIDIVKDITIQDGDVIAVASGDGLLNEVVNGLQQRTDGALKRARIAAVPVGSANGLAVSVGLGDVEEATVAAVQGRSQPLDLFTVALETGQKYTGLLCLTYAAIADIDIGSEWLRFLGGVRFNIYAVWLLLSRPKYRLSMQWRAQGVSGEESSKDDLFFFLLSNTSHISKTCGAARSQRTDSGSMALQFVTTKVAVPNLIKLFLSVDDGEHVKSKDVISSDIVHMRGFPDKKQRLVVDGELIPTENFELNVLPAATNIMVAR